MWSIAGHFRGAARAQKRTQEASLRKLWQMGSKNVAAMLRCAFMLLEVPKAPGGRKYILEAFSTRLTRHSVLVRTASHRQSSTLEPKPCPERFSKDYQHGLGLANRW